jgi:demethylmenaquinone methyltransferase/2-methoxy-6-polyprenyl-1,4-benzoquinol methylase
VSYSSRSSDNVKGFFSKIALSYDRLNSLMSVGLHHYWNQKLIENLPSQPEDTYLDLCAGTGAITERYLKKWKPSQKVILLDFCPQMLEVAQTNLKALQPDLAPSLTLEFINSDACQTPLNTSSINRVSMAYGLRNIIEPEKALAECFRIMKPGATLCILELTRPSSFWLASLHKIWLKTMIAGLAALYSQDSSAYKYLAESISHFIEPQKVLHLLTGAGFIACKQVALNGQIASLFTAQKPLSS